MISAIKENLWIISNLDHVILLDDALKCEEILTFFTNPFMDHFTNDQWKPIKYSRNQMIGIGQLTENQLKIHKWLVTLKQ